MFSSSHDWTDARTRWAAYLAARVGNLDTLAVVLRIIDGHGMDARREMLQEMINIAARRGHVLVLEMLFSKAETLGGTTPSKELLCTALSEAAMYGAICAVEWLLAQGADAKGCCSQAGLLPLHAAATYGHSDAVACVLAARADIDGSDRQGSTAILHAAFNGHTPVVEELLRRQASVETCDRKGMGPLHLASLRGHAVAGLGASQTGSISHSPHRIEEAIH